MFKYWAQWSTRPGVPRRPGLVTGTALATDKATQELFTKLAQHYKVLAFEVERAINKKEAG